MNPIINVVVVGFHHKRGCEVEYSYPSLDGTGEGGLPEEWLLLPSLALPDGVHNSDQDTIYFMLPSRTEKGKSVFAVSCYRQIAANELKSKSEDVTRTSVQKCVCVITRYPLFGAIKTKLEATTQAYFEQLDFSKVDVLSQMYDNFMDMLGPETSSDIISNLIYHDLSVQKLFIRFRHRALLLLKLLMLEKKVLFISSSGYRLGETMLAIISLFPKMLEDGLYHSTISLDSNYAKDCEIERKPRNEIDEIEIEEDIGMEYSRNDPLKNKDSYGFPLSIFAQGSYFDPYLSIQFMDHVSKVRSCVVGATNVLYSMKRDLFDVIVKIDDDGNFVHCHIEFTRDNNLERTLSLTSADLRFADFVLKKTEEQLKSSTAEFDGSDEWIRMQVQNYLLGLASTSKSDLQSSISHYGVGFVNEWRRTRNYRIWMVQPHGDIASVAPGHMFSEQQGVYDVYLRFEHAVNGVEGASKVFGSVNTAGKNLGSTIGETSNRVKARFSNWWKGRGGAQEGVEESVEVVEEGDDRKQ